MSEKYIWNKYDKYLFVLILFIMFGNIGGALTPSRPLALLLAPAMIKKWKDCKYVQHFFTFFVLFYLFCLFSILWTPDRTQGFKELVYYPIHILYFFELLVFAKYANHPLKSLAWGWTMVIFLCSFVALWELLTDNHLSMAVQEEDEVANIGGEIVSRFTASVTFGNPNAYVTILCYSFPWIVYMTQISTKKMYQKAIITFAFIMSIVVILVNVSRGGLLSFLIMAVVYVLLSSKTFWKSIGLIVLSAVGIYVLIEYGSDILAIIRMRAMGSEISSDDARISIWTVCINLLVNSFFIGTGVGSITAALQNASTNIVASPHSLFFEVLVQYGVVFTLILVVFILKLLIKSWHVKDKTKRMVLMMALIAMPVYTIINSGYLLGVDLFALIGTIYLFLNIDEL